MLHKDDELANNGDNTGNGDKPKPQRGYEEGTADDDGNGKPNVPGPGEVPDQQKVGEDDDDEKYHVET